MQSALIGLLGVFVGILLTELFRKQSRVEQFWSPVFAKRLDAHEALYKKVQSSYCVLCELYENNEYPIEERHEMAVADGMSLMNLLDEHDLFLGEKLTVHIGMLWVGSAGIFSKEFDEKTRDEMFGKFRESYKETKDLIKKSSGISKIDENVSKALKSKLSSNYINTYMKLKKGYEKNRKDV